MTQGLLLLLMFGQLADSEDFPKALQERALVATVRIVNSTQRAEGSGVLIGQKEKWTYVLTAAHFVKDGDRLQISTFTVDSYPDRDKLHREVEVLALAKDMRDLALLRFKADKPPRGSLSLCPTRLVLKDKEFEALSVGCGAAAAPVCIIEKVKTAKQIRRSEEMRSALFWETENEQTPGRSGGPLIDKRGRVIGVASGANEGKGYYCHPDEIHRWLKSIHYDFLISEEKPQRNER